jgi:hypothetical protein
VKKQGKASIIDLHQFKEVTREDCIEESSQEGGYAHGMRNERKQASSVKRKETFNEKESKHTLMRRSLWV